MSTSMVVSEAKKISVSIFIILSKSFFEVKRVLKPTGSFWLNIGDSYYRKTLLGIPWRIALELIDHHDWIIRNSDDVRSRASQCYEETGGTEVVVLDCIGFLRHFLHFFHRSRIEFLNAYQELVLSEPDSAVSQQLKEVFLVLRRAAETGSE